MVLLIIMVRAENFCDSGECEGGLKVNRVHFIECIVTEMIKKMLQ